MKQEIIYTEDYALIVSDEDYNPNDVILANDLSALAKVLQNKNAHILAESIPHKTELGIMYHQSNDWKKVIGHRPLNDASILEGVILLPEFNEEDDVQLIAKQEAEKLHDKSKHEDWDIYDELVREDAWLIKKGYDKAKETYKYTEEDLRKAFTAGLMNRYSRVGEAVAETEFVQSLQQPKRPNYFEMETTYRVKSGTIQEHKDGLAGFEYYELEVITNSLGQTELVGTYIY